MSGGVGPSSDILLPKEEHEHEHEHKLVEDPSIEKVDTTNQKKSPARKSSSYFSFSQLNSLAVIVVLAASGMVSIRDSAFVVFSFIYMFFLSKVAFPVQSPATYAPVFNENNKILRLYVFIGAIIGLFLPIAYILGGIVERDQKGIQVAVPHVFLLASQVFVERISLSNRFSVPIRVCVQVVYNSARILALTDWLWSEMLKVDEEKSGSIRRMYVGRGLAIANMAFWCINLFGFLLPFYLPKAFKIYYSNAAATTTSKVKD